MKKYLLLFILPLALSCGKEDEAKVADTEPKVVSVQFTSVYQAGRETLRAKVTVDIPEETSIKKLTMYQSESVEAGSTEKPKSGTYTLYHLTFSYPTGKKYYFVFTKSDNTEVKSDLYVCTQNVVQ